MMNDFPMLASMLTGVSGGALALVAMLFLVWIYSVIARDSGIIDVFWALGFVLLALVSLAFAPSLSWGALAIALAVILWGLRLASHLFTRWRGESEEDPRYQAMRRRHGAAWWWRSLIIVFALQGLLLWLVGLPFMVVVGGGGVIGSSLIVLIGLGIAACGLFMETTADIQLTRFRATAKRGELLTSGWWRFTRHPNYFGDALFWWGIWLACIGVMPEAIWTIFAPILMNYLLLKISGADLLDKYLRKKTGYAEYATRVPRFVPKFW